MSENLIDKAYSILMEYALAPYPTNINVYSGLGGNTNYYGYTNGKPSIITSEVADVDIVDGKILWNAEFLSQPKKIIREKLDAKVKAKIEEEGFTFINNEFSNIDPELVDDIVKNASIEKLFAGEERLPDTFELNTYSGLVLCMRICSHFAQHIDNNTASNLYKPFHSIMCRFDDATALLSIRTQIGLARIIKNNLDENEHFHTYFSQLTNSLGSLE